VSDQERVRFEVAFDGGQILGGFATAASVDQLERTLAAGGEGVVTLSADDGEVTVAPRRVVYFKRFARESRVGFGQS
jgi:uncharacterized protein (AIM24 family)